MTCTGCWRREEQTGKKWRKGLCPSCLYKDYKKNNPDYWRKALLKKYKLTEAQYEKMYKSQNGSCAICKEVNINGKRLCVDHNHKTGRVRGLLCQTCNRSIGLLKDNIHLLNKAVDYLEGVIYL